jgi:hypothetical protein
MGRSALQPATAADIDWPDSLDQFPHPLQAEELVYSPDVRLFLEAGELVLATDYIKALRVRTRMQQEWATMFEDIDVLVAPSTPITDWHQPEPTPDPEASIWSRLIRRPEPLSGSDVVIEGELKGMWAKTEGIDLILALERDPGLDKVRSEDATF